MRKKRRSTPYTVIFLTFVFLATYLLADYFDIPTAIGIDISRFNIDLFGIVVNAVIAIVIFALGYYFVEQWNIKKSANQKALAESALCRCYHSCLYFSNLLESFFGGEDPLTFESHSAMMDIISLFEERPFSEEALIQQYMLEGLLTKEQTDNYLSIRNAYKTFVFLKINPEFKDSFATSVKKSFEKLVHTSLDNLSSAQS